MTRTDRLIVLAVFIALAIYRLIRYYRAAGTKRAHSAIPASGGIVLPRADPAAASAPTNPIADPGSAANRGLGGLAAVLVWAAGCVAAFLVLFEWPGLAEVPALWRLVALVFVSFCLAHLARAAGERVRRRRTDAPSADHPRR